MNLLVAATWLLALQAIDPGNATFYLLRGHYRLEGGNSRQFVEGGVGERFLEVK